ncbi:hypothetical protein OGAPHI_000720 [Ogataea philodendri]|uniref:Ribosome-assembly protein 3 C-terminal domain-containing protein n=1 Tax=Ogataea philodendri TaxID=1378263 RepID=A0A9P8PGU6_9ASCO|nr:uncharacterized protein OGAPHI_000720 [Ogataea philodendri]KAH3671009.1 hypothetical protein OGAPHI_000720 [Ogataea philodendri]
MVSRRTRKKRRTEDFSSSSESDSESSSNEDTLRHKSVSVKEEDDSSELAHDSEPDPGPDSGPDSDVDRPQTETRETRETRQTRPTAASSVPDGVQEALNQLNTTLPNISKQVNMTLRSALTSATATIGAARNQLDSQYLNQAVNTYSGDLDVLRQGRNTLDESLKTIANVLKATSNLFDDETLRSMVNRQP